MALGRYTVTVGLAALVVAGVALALRTDAQDTSTSTPELTPGARLPMLAADSASPVASPTPTASATATSTATAPSPSPTTSTSTATAPSPSPTASTSTPVPPTPTPTVVAPQFRELTITQAGTEAIVMAELALTPQQRQHGLMGTTSLSDEEGMLFVFPSASQSGFWMAGTPIPLDIAYLDAAGFVMEIRHGVPYDLTSLKPTAPYWYVLEVPGGWFERMEMGVGAQVHIPTDLPLAT